MTTFKKRPTLVPTLGLALFTSFFALSACGDDGGDGPEILDTAGTHTQFVINKLSVPKTLKEANDVSLDLDGDGHKENALGKLLAALASTANLDLQSGIDEQLADGTFILLPSIKATDLANANGVGTYLFFGENSNPAPCTDALDPDTCGKHLNGSASFDVTADSPADSLIVGSTAAGELKGGPGKVSIKFPLGDTAPLQLDLIAAHIEASVSPTEMTNAKLGGAITSDDVDNKLIPAVQVLVTSLIAKDCTGTPVGTDCGCMTGSAGKAVIDFFDENDDCMIPVDELKNNQLILGSLREPDLDLLDANGDFNPNSDGIADSLSLSMGFTAVGASFTVPANAK